MKKVLSFLLVVVFTLSLTACSQGANAVYIVKNGELSDYPGKPIAKTFDEVLGERNDDYQAEWLDKTDDELGKTILKTMETSEYDRVVTLAISASGDEAIFAWLVNTKTGVFDLCSVYDGSDILSPDDPKVVQLLDGVFNS